MFSWTNLLTRCPVPVFCFLLFFVSEILHRKYSRNCTGRKPPTLHYRHVHGHQRRDGGEPRGPYTSWWRDPTSRRARRWCGAHRAPLGSGLRPYIPLRRKTLNTRSLFHEKFRRRRRHQPRSGGFWSSSRHPAGEEIVTGGLYITMPASSVIRE